MRKHVSASKINQASLWIAPSNFPVQLVATINKARFQKTIMSMLRIVAVLAVVYVAVAALVYFRQRSLLYFPSHEKVSSHLVPWLDAGQTIGYCRETPNPHAIWLMMHGNGGQAADRDYVLPHISDADSLYVLEYPGYGARQGSPSSKSINQAASSAYQSLRTRHPGAPICALGESLGSGAACALAREKTAPDKIVLVVPFDNLVSVASQHFPFLPVWLMLKDRWDNVESLKNYKGPVDIFGAREDTIIPIEHARVLANHFPAAHFLEIPGRHNDWSQSDLVKIKL
jgi:hypothetical protein